MNDSSTSKTTLPRRQEGCSIRMTLDYNSEIVSTQDYSSCGEILRQYDLDGGVNDKHKFTEKESAFDNLTRADRRNTVTNSF